ncbi:alkaline phosphatase [Streptococcus ovis]
MCWLPHRCCSLLVQLINPMGASATAETATSVKIDCKAAKDSKQAKNWMLCSKEEYDMLKAAFEETKKEYDNQNVNYGGYIPVSITATRIVDKKAGLAWTTTDHSGDKVPVYAMGSGAYMFDGEFDDTDVAIRIGDAMGFNEKVASPTDSPETETKKTTGVGLKALTE